MTSRKREIIGELARKLYAHMASYDDGTSNSWQLTANSIHNELDWVFKARDTGPVTGGGINAEPIRTRDLTPPPDQPVLAWRGGDWVKAKRVSALRQWFSCETSHLIGFDHEITHWRWLPASPPGSAQPRR